MRKFLLTSKRIALFLAAMAAISLNFSVTAHGAARGREAFEDGEGGSSAILVNIDKTSQSMTVSVNGAETYRWPVSTGRDGYSTPSGSYTATSMNEIWYSKEWDNAPMPHAVFFIRDGHAIHGTYDVRNLGKPASHGCVRLSTKNAATLFALVKENGLRNTRVVVGGSTSGGESLTASREAEQPVIRQTVRPMRQPASAQSAERQARRPARRPPPSEPSILSGIFGFQ